MEDACLCCPIPLVLIRDGEISSPRPSHVPLPSFLAVPQRSLPPLAFLLIAMNTIADPLLLKLYAAVLGSLCEAHPTCKARFFRPDDEGQGQPLPCPDYEHGRLMLRMHWRDCHDQWLQTQQDSTALAEHIRHLWIGLESFTTLAEWLARHFAKPSTFFNALKGALAARGVGYLYGRQLQVGSSIGHIPLADNHRSTLCGVW
jgi:hypothetical protein